MISAAGCLKFLSTTNCNRYRIACMGALPLIQDLYLASDKLILRRSAQVLLVNASMLAENSAFLKEANIGEEFRVPVPMTLAREECAEMKEEFGALPGQERESTDFAEDQA